MTTAQTGLEHRKQHKKFEQCLGAYGIPARYRGLTLFQSKYMKDRTAEWLANWRSGEILSKDSEHSGKGVLVIAQPKPARAFCAALVQDALRLSSQLDIRPANAVLWVPSIAAMHDDLRKDETPALSMNRLTSATILVLPELDPNHSYALDTVERIVRTRVSKGLPTILSEMNTDTNRIRASLNDLLTEVSEVVDV